MTDEQIARVCHEVNRAYCLAPGDDSQPPWEDAPAWQRNSALDGVRFHLENPDLPASASHVRWMERKIEEGWRWGPDKDPQEKTHPCIKPFDDLSKQQAKDFIFQAIVNVLGATSHESES